MCVLVGLAPFCSLADLLVDVVGDLKALGCGKLDRCPAADGDAERIRVAGVLLVLIVRNSDGDCRSLPARPRAATTGQRLVVGRGV